MTFIVSLGYSNVLQPPIERCDAFICHALFIIRIYHYSIAT